MRLERDAAVGQRPATDAGGLRHRHAREETEIEPSVLSRRVAVVKNPCIAWLARVLLRRPSPPSLEDEHLQALLGSAARGDGAAETAADDNRVERFTHATAIGRTRSRLTAYTCIMGSLTDRSPRGDHRRFPNARTSHAGV